MSKWHFRIEAPAVRPIRAEEVHLMCQLLPPSILALIARDDPNMAIVQFDARPSAKGNQPVAVAGDTA